MTHTRTHGDETRLFHSREDREMRSTRVIIFHFHDLHVMKTCDSQPQLLNPCDSQIHLCRHRW